VRILINQAKFDLLAISESKLNSDISDAEISVPNYNLLRLDRERNGGGVAIYCHENYSFFA